MKELFGEVISKYTREEAISDGTLIDISQTAKECGFKFPVAVTSAVWSEILEPDEKASNNGESVDGRLWDLVFMLHVAIKRSTDGNAIVYNMIATKNGKHKTYSLRAVIGPGDTAEPVITIMLPHED